MLVSPSDTSLTHYQHGLFLKALATPPTPRLRHGERTPALAAARAAPSGSAAEPL